MGKLMVVSTHPNSEQHTFNGQVVLATSAYTREWQYEHIIKVM